MDIKTILSSEGCSSLLLLVSSWNLEFIVWSSLYLFSLKLLRNLSKGLPLLLFTWSVLSLLWCDYLILPLRISFNLLLKSSLFLILLHFMSTSQFELELLLDSFSSFESSFISDWIFSPVFIVCLLTFTFKELFSESLSPIRGLLSLIVCYCDNADTAF